MLATASAAVTIPHTPAGRALAAWLTAFNSGERDQLASFYRVYQPRVPLDFMMRFRATTGGLDLISITRSEPRHIEFLVTNRANHDRAAGELDLTDTSPPRLLKSPVYLIAPHAAVIGFRIDAAVRARVIRAIAAKLNKLYVLPDVGTKMAVDITARWQRGEYKSITEGDTFAQQLTSDLRTVSHDRHLRVTFSAALIPDSEAAQSAASAERQRAQLAHDNCGFKRVELLPWNIGYVRFDEFGDPTVCTGTVAAAMGFLVNADAIIFDLRQNGGGDPALVALLESYLFSSRTHLDDFWDRPSGHTTQTWTLPSVPGKRLPSVPVYILTSHHTRGGLTNSDTAISGRTAVHSHRGRSSTDAKTKTQPFAGVQGSSGPGSHKGREDRRRDCQAV